MYKRLASFVLAFCTAFVAIAENRTVTLTVKGWTCGSCAAATRIALKKLDGVEDVKTDVARATAVVTYDDSKTAPEKLIQAIERVGYQARVETVSAGAAPLPSTQAIAPVAAEAVSFFEVPLECGAADRLGCGSASKPVLKKLDADPTVKEAKINYPGTVLAVVWKDPSHATAGVPLVEGAFKDREMDVSLLKGAARDKAAKDFAAHEWYGAGDMDRLSRHEAEVIAARLVNRARAGLGLSPARLDALTKDLSNGIASILTRDKGEDCARDPFEELSKIASKHLDPQQMAVLRKAAEQGAGALPGEAR